jgi:hypothetical protein
MPTEVIMNGGAPWGFRLSGGGTQSLTVSRLTPGGKAALDGVMQGDHVIAINGQQVSGLQLGELMELIKNTGNTLNLTTICESEVQAQDEADTEAACIKAGLVEEHVECIDVEPAAPEPEPVCEEPECEEPAEEPECAAAAAPAALTAEEELAARQAALSPEDKETMSKKEWYGLPTYIRKSIRPPKPEPNFKPQVGWMHRQLRLGKPGPGKGAVDAAGGQLRNAVMACQGPIELKAGPINGKISHSQYNTPLQMYSDPQIVTTLMSQAVASGADIQDPSYFQNSGVKVDTESAVYKRINETDSYQVNKQSRSFNILNTLLKHPYEPEV